MNRIDATFQKLQEQGRKALIPFVTAGDAGLDTTEQLVLQLEASGADIIELGVPFSDPIAEGPVIQEASVYEDFGAYILVLDGRGQLMSNLKAAYVQDPAFVTSLNQKELNQALNEVLGGEEISVRTMVDGAPTFTVGVPFVQNNQVLGAVLIQTKAQTIEGGTGDFLQTIVLWGAARRSWRRCWYFSIPGA